jgi:hypothetical protein
MKGYRMRKEPVRTQEIALKDDYEGWTFTARMNPPISAFSDVASGDFVRIAHGLAKVIRQWNFVDEDGVELPAPTETLISERPLDLVTAMTQAYVEELNKLPPR